MSNLRKGSLSANVCICAIQKSEPMLIETICNHISERIENNELSNEDCITIIEHIGGYLNLKTISDYAKNNGKSYNGVKKFRKIKEIFNVKFVIDNK